METLYVVYFIDCEYIYICIEFIRILYNIYSIENFTKFDVPKYQGKGSYGFFEGLAYPMYINYGIIGLLTFYGTLLGIVSFFMVRSFRNRKKK